MLSFPRNDIVVKIKFSLVKSTRKTSMGYFIFFYDPEFIQYAKANRLCNIIIIFIDKQRYNKKNINTMRKSRSSEDFLHDIFMVHSVKHYGLTL